MCAQEIRPPHSADADAVDSVNGATGTVVLDADDLSDTSTTNKFTTSANLTKLSGIATGAEVNVQSDWDATSGDAFIANKPTLGSAAAADTGDFAAASHTHTASDVTDFDTEVGNNTDVAANTAARHSHSNKSVLDATTASFTTADETKLDGIEASADVTDAANVAAAGAVMESDTSTANMSFVVDEDDLSSDSATKVPTQQSVKAYVDANSGGASDLDDLSDVAITSATSGQVLKYNGSTWVNDDDLTGDGGTTVTSVNSETGAVVLDADDIGLGNVDNTSDAAKPVSDATQTALDGKVDDDDADYLANTDARHTHANKSTLDDVTDARLVPGGGAWYQVLRRGEGDPAWVDPAGVVPDLLALPGGSYDRNGAITVTASASVEVRDGAWWVAQAATNILDNIDVSYESASPSGYLSPPTVDTGFAATGSHASRIDGPTSNVPISGVFRAPGAVEGMPHVFAATVYHNGASDRDVYLRYNGDNGPSFPVPPNTAMRLSRQVTGGPYPSYSSVMVGNLLTGESAWVDALQLTEGTEDVGVIPLIAADGSPEPGYEWLGYVNSSQSRRLAGVLTIPCATRPETTLVRARDAGYVVTLDDDDEATLGTRATVQWDGTDLIITATYLDIEILGVAAYTDALTDDTAAGLLATPSRWSFGGMIPSYVPPDLATVATSGDYTDLANTPTIPDALADLDTTVTGAQLNSLKSKVDGIEASADVTDATNVAAAGAVMESDTSTASMSFVVDEDAMSSDSATKVPTQQSVKAYVDANAGGSVAWGEITGTLADQTDLDTALDGKSDTGHTHTDTFSIVFTFDGHGGPIPTGETPAIYLPFAFTITGYVLEKDSKSSTSDFSLDVRASAFSTSSSPDGTDSICGGNNPVADTANLHTTTLTGWTTSHSAGISMSVEVLANQNDLNTVAALTLICTKVVS